MGARPQRGWTSRWCLPLVQVPGLVRDPQGYTSRMFVAPRWELALNGAGAPDAACLWYMWRSVQKHPEVSLHFHLVTSTTVIFMFVLQRLRNNVPAEAVCGNYL